MGVSVETEKYAHRIDDLRKTGAQVKFLSLEPLLGVGGESGPGARALRYRAATVRESVPGSEPNFAPKTS
jgi:protein gp37